jgi:Lon protease-like protein
VEPLRIVPSTTSTRLAPQDVDEMALKRLREMRAFLSINNITDVHNNSSLASDGDDNELYEYRLSKWRHPAHYAMYDNRVTLRVSDEDGSIPIISFPEINNAKELRATIRSIYWLNNRNNVTAAKLGVNDDAISATYTNSDEDYDDITNKRRISLAFNTIKTCNQLSSSELDVRCAKRYISLEVRQGVDILTYHIGQMIQHIEEKWTGVIVGWIPNTKHDIVPQYVVLVDTNDATLFQLPALLNLVSQTNLSPIIVDSGGGEGIFNALTKEYFTKFIPPTEDERGGGGQYVPNRILEYMYPLDRQMGKLVNDDKKNCEQQKQSHQEVIEEGDNCNPLYKGIDSVSWLPSVHHDHSHNNNNITDVDTTTTTTTTTSDDDGVIKTLPLFPLGTMIYLPGSTHILSIFEPRYRKMYDDIMSIGSKRFVVSACHPTEDGKFARMGVLFEITDMEDISQVVGDRVKYICNHRVIGRVKLHSVLNPKAWVTKETYLEAEGTIIYDDVDNNSTVMTTNNDPTELLKKNADENALEKQLAQCYRDIVDMQHDLNEGLLISTDTDDDSVLGFTEGNQFWKFVNVWQSYSQLRLKVEQDNLHRGFYESTIGLSRKENITTGDDDSNVIENLSPELQLELKDLQRLITDSSKRTWLDWTLSMQKILEAKNHVERLKLMIYFVEVERKRLERKKTSRDILLGLSPT